MGQTQTRWSTHSHTDHHQHGQQRSTPTFRHVASVRARPSASPTPCATSQPASCMHAQMAHASRDSPGRVLSTSTTAVGQLGGSAALPSACLCSRQCLQSQWGVFELGKGRERFPEGTQSRSRSYLAVHVCMGLCMGFAWSLHGVCMGFAWGFASVRVAFVMPRTRQQKLGWLHVLSRTVSCIDREDHAAGTDRTRSLRCLSCSRTSSTPCRPAQSLRQVV